MSVHMPGHGSRGDRSAWALVSVALALSAACSGGGLEIEETDVVVTLKDEGRDYSELKTYVLTPSVADLCPTEVEFGDTGMGMNPGGAGGEAGITPPNCRKADHSLDEEILAALRRNLDETGYEEVDGEEEAPDVALFVGLVAQSHWYEASGPVYCSYDAWMWGCWYAPHTYLFNLTTNAIVIDMAVVSESEDGLLSSAWTAVIQGLYASSENKTGRERVDDAIDQAFAQSPYLKEGGSP